MDDHRETEKSVISAVSTRLFLQCALISAFVSSLVGVVLYFSLEERTAASLREQPVITVHKEGEGIPDAVAKVAPAVVSVVISAEVPIVERYYEEYNPFGRFFGDNLGLQIPRERQLGTKRQEIGGGSGFIVSSDGFVVTNRHVVDIEDGTFTVIMSDGTNYEAEVVARDQSLDIALLKIRSDTAFPYLNFGKSDEIRVGETVIAIGNVLSEFPNSVSVGVVSGVARSIIAGDGYGSAEALEGLIQTDAAINLGNSGGPLLNTDGEVIGVNVAVAGNSENIGFAIPSESVQSIVESVKVYGEIIRSFVGVRYKQIDQQMAKTSGLSLTYGILVVRGDTPNDAAVVPGSPAAKAGIVEGDIILEFDGKKLDGKTSFASLVRTKKVGDTVSLKVLSEGVQKDLIVTLERAPSI